MVSGEWGNMTVFSNYEPKFELEPKPKPKPEPEPKPASHTFFPKAGSGTTLILWLVVAASASVAWVTLSRIRQG